MKRVIIIGEGQTEQAFCNDVLQPHLNASNIYVHNPTIKKTMGGIVRWAALKHQIETHLLQDPGAYVTTLIDYYGLYAHHNYPEWERAERQRDGNLRMDTLEAAMQADIDPNLQKRFIPYIQLHEFEGLLFSDLQVFEDSFEADEFDDYDYLVETIERNANPELINNGQETAPSKRLQKIIKGYYSENENMKVFYGSILAHDIGLEKIRAKCPRFNNWLSKLENL